MSILFETNIDLNGNQVMNFIGHKLSQHPSSPKEGFLYYNTTDHCFYYYNGTDWITNPKVSHFITATSADTLQNKIINADNNILQNLNLSNFANGVVVSTLGATATNSSIPTEKAVRDAIDTALVGGLIYKGSWIATGQTDFSSIELPVKKGYTYLVTGNQTTINNITYTAGDYIIINTDTSSTETLTQARIDKVDNTESSDIVRTSASQTLTNKAISGSNNTISNLTLDMFKSGEIVNSISSGSSKAVTSGAVYTELSGKAPIVSPSFSGVPTVPTAEVGTNNSQIASTAFVQNAIASKGTVNKVTATNSTLTPSNGLATWTISHTLGAQDVLVRIFRVSDNKEIITEIALTSATTVTVSFNSTEEIAENTYKAIIIG